MPTSWERPHRLLSAVMGVGEVVMHGRYVILSQVGAGRILSCTILNRYICTIFRLFSVSLLRLRLIYQAVGIISKVGSQRNAVQKKVYNLASNRQRAYIRYDKK